jgi:hypothetical protein
MYKYLLIVVCLFSCNKQTEAQEKQPEVKQTQTEFKQTEPVKVAEPVKVKNGSLNIPKGKDCEKHLPKDALKQSKKNDGYYIPKESFWFVNMKGEGVLLANFTVVDMKLKFTVNLLNGNKVNCIEENSDLGIRFNKHQIHILESKFPRNCNDPSKTEERVGAMAIYTLPLNSTLFKELLLKPVEFLGIELKGKGYAFFQVTKEETPIELQNAARCAYEAFGGADQINLEDEDFLIDTLAHPDENSNE